LLNLEAHVLQRPELLDFVTLKNFPAMGKVDGFAHKIPRFSRQHFTKSRVLLIFAMSNQITLREIFDRDDVVGHWPLNRWVSDDVRKASAAQHPDSDCLPASNSQAIKYGLIPIR
jgi:hypothetical protein